MFSQKPNKNRELLNKRSKKNSNQFRTWAGSKTSSAAPCPRRARVLLRYRTDRTCSGQSSRFRSWFRSGGRAAAQLSDNELSPLMSGFVWTEPTHWPIVRNRTPSRFDPLCSLSDGGQRSFGFPEQNTQPNERTELHRSGTVTANYPAVPKCQQSPTPSFSSRAGPDQLDRTPSKERKLEPEPTHHPPGPG